MYIIEVIRDTEIIWTAVCETQTALLKAVDDAKQKIVGSSWTHTQPAYNEVACYQSQTSDYIIVKQPDVIYSV